MSPDEYCKAKTAASGSSFYYSFLFLPPPQRRAITALYAFCREVDDAVDECNDPAVAQAKLHWWRQEVAQGFAGSPRHPVMRALQEPIAEYDLPHEYFQEILDGMQMDLEQNRYASFNDLALYCYRVAGVIGLMSVEIFGYESKETLKYAVGLGTAFQLTNILRDLREDAARGRIYLPLDDLRRFQVQEQDILELRTNARLQRLLEFETGRARQLFAEAFKALPEVDRYTQRSGLIMAQIYLATLAEIERDRFQVMERRVTLTPLRKLWIAWRTARREQRRWKQRSYAANPR